MSATILSRVHCDVCLVEHIDEVAPRTLRARLGRVGWRNVPKSRTLLARLTEANRVEIADLTRLDLCDECVDHLLPDRPRSQLRETSRHHGPRGVPV